MTKAQELRLALLWFLAGLALCAVAWMASCTQVDRTIYQNVPTQAQLAGDYSVDWGPANMYGVASIDGDVLRFQPYPCRPLGSEEWIGGGIDYDDQSGRLDLEAKNLAGTARIVAALYATGEEVRGSYEVHVVGIACVGGQMVMVRDL